jgi:hypothetical protein
MSRREFVPYDFSGDRRIGVAGIFVSAQAKFQPARESPWSERVWLD